MRKRSSCVLTKGAVFLLTASIGFAQTSVHPTPVEQPVIRLVRAGTGAVSGFTTIQAAVDAANNFDVVEIPAGTYTGPGNKDVQVAKRITIVGTDGAANTIVDCEGSGRGFHFQFGSTSATTLQDITVRNGAATSGGAVLLDNGIDPQVIDCVFEFCGANEGGALYAKASTLRLRGVVFRNNTAQAGGAMFLGTMTGLVQECTIEDNVATVIGGGVALVGPLMQDPITGVRFEDTLFQRNHAPSAGALYGEFIDSFFMDRCTVVENTADNNTGGIAVTGDFFLAASDIIFIQNSVIARNTAADTAGVNVALAAIVIQNCTIADNEATTGVNGGLSAAGDGVFLLNSIVWGNKGATGSIADQQLLLVTNPALTLVFFNDLQGIFAAMNISADPLFANPVGLDYHLTDGSPCIDAGLNFSLALGQTDIDGQPRIQRALIDIGADEFDSSGVVCETLDFEGFVNGHAVTASDFDGEGITLRGLGPNHGLAIFDSDPAGPNSWPDPDLLVDLGNILILQQSPDQTIPGIFDDPDDAHMGGLLILDFDEPVELRSVDLIDIDQPPPAQWAELLLLDDAGRTRSFVVPSAWTTDVFEDGPPGYGTLELTTLAPQPGVASTATSTEDPGFDPLNVRRLEIRLNSSGAVDNLVYCSAD